MRPQKKVLPGGKNLINESIQIYQNCGSGHLRSHLRRVGEVGVRTLRASCRCSDEQIYFPNDEKKLEKSFVKRLFRAFGSLSRERSSNWVIGRGAGLGAGAEPI